MLVDDADEGESSGGSNSGNYVFQKYFRSACIINGSTPFGGTQIANMAAATAILPPPPPSVKKIVHIQQQNHEKQRSKKILELETRGKVAVNVPPPPEVASWPRDLSPRSEAAANDAAIARVIAEQGGYVGLPAIGPPPPPSSAE